MGKGLPTSRLLPASFLQESGLPRDFFGKENKIFTIYHDTEATRKASDHTISLDKITEIQTLGTRIVY